LAFPSYGVQHTLWLLHNSSRFDEIKNPEYAIYIFIDDHFRRALSAFPFVNFPYSESFYEIRNGKIYEESKSRQFIYHSYFYRLLSFYIGNFKYTSPFFKDYREDKVITLFKEEKRLFEERYPDIKFVVMMFPYSLNNDASFLDKIRKEGIQVVDGYKIFKKQTDTEFQHQEEWFLPNDHPTEEMFELFVPDIVNELKL